MFIVISGRDLFCFVFWTNLSLAFAENFDRTNRKKNTDRTDDERTTSRLFDLYHRGKYSCTRKVKPGKTKSTGNYTIPLSSLLFFKKPIFVFVTLDCLFKTEITGTQWYLKIPRTLSLHWLT